jgi:protein-disulfide isomerase
LSPSERDRIERRVRRYFKKVVDLPDDVHLDLVGLEPAPDSALLRADLEIANDVGSRRVPIVVTRDGRYLVQGTLADLSVDPWAETMRQIRLDGRPARGAAEAPVTVVTWIDFQCPFSARVFRTLVEGLLPGYRNQVRLVFKSFPLADVHPWAEAAAAAAECALEADDELFFSLAGALFEKQETLTAETLGEWVRSHLAAHAGAAEADVLACIDAAGGVPRVRADAEEGGRLGVRSTPTIFLNGRKLEGARPLEDLVAAVDAALASATPVPD